MRNLSLSIYCGLLFIYCASSTSAAEVAIYDRVTHRALPIYQHHGRTYIVGEPGHEYEIRIHNESPQRMLAVTTVDGINVITGETAAFEQSGYVVDAFSQENIQGWRKSMAQTAAFYFTSITDSYAALTGRAQQAGVIGVALFRERASPRALQDSIAPLDESRADRDADNAPLPNASAALEKSSAARKHEFGLGTGHGAREYSAARYTHFERALAAPDETISIYYDSRSNLMAHGIIPREHRYAERWPQPFPQSVPGFTPDP